LTQAGQTCLHAPLKAEFELPIPFDRGPRACDAGGCRALHSETAKGGNRTGSSPSNPDRPADERDFLMHARIVVLQAIHHDDPTPAPSPRKGAAKYRIVK
jgi:hypothetical protein